MGETAYSNSTCVCTDRIARSKAALASRPARLLWRSLSTALRPARPRPVRCILYRSERRSGAVAGICEEACVEHLCCVGRNQPVQVISSRHQYAKGFRYTQKIDRLDMHRMAQSLEGGLQKTFALRRMGMDRCSDVLEPRAHLERQAETSRQFRNPGAHSLNAE